jgi:hypothetical protein
MSHGETETEKEGREESVKASFVQFTSHPNPIPLIPIHPIKPMSSAINQYLLIIGSGLFGIGFLMHMKPMLLLELTHNNVSSLQRETPSVMSGWGYKFNKTRLI